MATAHIIDEVVFDFSFDSIAIARAHESDINSWLIEQLLPIVDSILNTYDDAQTVLRMEHLALDLGDISSDDFHSEMIRKVSEQLTEQLRDARKNSVFDETYAEKSPSATRPSLPLSPSTSQVKQVSQTQVDTERLIDFLLTGNMAWHIDISETNVHENMLAQVLQQTDATFVQFLQRSSATTRNVLISRLVQQFSPQHLASFLAKLAPTSAHLISDLMAVMQSALIHTQSDTPQPEELTKWLWMQTFETLLEEVQESDCQTVVIQRVFRKFEKLQGRVPDLMGRKIVKIAENLSSKQKINDELPKILLELINGSSKQIIGKDVTSLDTSAPQKLISNETQIIKNPLSSTDISANHTKQDQTATNTAIYQRIVKAIIMANIPGIDIKVLTLGEPVELAEPGKIRQQLLLLIERDEIRAQFAQVLPERALLDMVYLLSPQVAALIEQLLAQSTILTQVTDVVKQSGQSSIATWQQQLWTGGLAVLTTAQNKTLDPAEYLLAIARWFSPSQSATTVMQPWSIALAQSQNYGTLHNMLQQLIAQQDQHSFSVGVTVGVDANVGTEVSTESEPLAVTQRKVSGSLVYQQLYQRLSATQSYKASKTDIDITFDLQTVINKLATDNPDELHHIFQALRQGELVLADAQLQGEELQSLVMAWIQMDTPNVDKDIRDFVLAIERHAALANDQAVYYQWVLDALLQGDLVDLEAIALQRQYAPTSTPASIPVPTEKSTISKKVQESSATEIYSPTINTAIYQRIVQAIVKANIPGLDAKALTLGESPTGLTELSVIRQQVLLLIQQAEIHAHLAEKLPERVLLDLVYLLSPQAAALIEQLLVQSTILAQAIDTAKQSGQSSIAAWQQQLWVGSLAALISDQNKTLDPAEYLQALARWFSPSQSATTVMQTWSTALAQSQNYGMLYDMLQQSMVQQGAAANMSATVNAESAAPTALSTKVSGSPAYQQLYQYLSVTQPSKADKTIPVDLQTVIDKLATDNPEELRGIFQALHQGELVLATVKLKEVELRSLITALIQMNMSGISGFQQDFVQAITHHAAQAKDQIVYYQLVFDALLQGEVVDLEAFVLQEQYVPNLTPVPALERTPTEKSVVSEKIQKTVAPAIINTQIANTAIYQRIIQAIAKAKIPGIKIEVLTLGEPPIGPVELSELNELSVIDQQLLLLIQQAEMHPQLAEKLPERVLLDIVYLFSPQAAALTEQLLAQSIILAQATDAEKQSSQNIQSSQSSIAAWRQQLWTGSLAALMTAQEKMLDPTEYLQVLARWFSPSQSSLAVLQTWSTALAQSQKYGTLYNMLQQLIAQQDQHSFNVGVNVDANVDTEVSAESEPLAASQTKVSGSRVYQQLYQRLSATQSDKARSKTDIDITFDLQTVINKLAGDSPEELHHIFQALRQGELSLSTAKLQSAELLRLITALIQMDSSDVGEVQQDFVHAIERHAGQAKDQTVYYYLVLEALLQGEAVDLEAFALKRVLENNMPMAAQPNAVDNISPSQDALDSVVPAKKPALIILDDALGLSSEAEVTEEIYINNAGQVLAAPYLPRLFSVLNLMKDGEFVDRSSAERAVHLLQFMVNEQTQSPEYQLLLNKILCGITTGIPICREIAISAQESALIEDFIRGMIQNWKTIGETSISGLRQTFLQRKGRLKLKEGMWYLTIEPGTFDMLLDGLPWSFSVIKHAWMERVIHVTWR